GLIGPEAPHFPKSQFPLHRLAATIAILPTLPSRVLSMLLAVAYVQDLDPLNNRLLSTLVAALPVVVLFFLLVVRRWLAPKAGAAGAATAILIAWFVYGMPIDMTCLAFLHGIAFGLLPIGWTVFAAMLLYNVTVETGQFAIIRRSVASLS